MELTIAISLISVAIAISSFVLGRKDKAVKDAKENNLALINYRLDKLDENVKKILDKLEDYETEVDEKIDKAIEHHIKEYHK